ncbi:MAG: 30S ribosomal protein S8e [Thermoplasmata archaeon]
MALWQGKSTRKTSGGRRRPARKKRKFEIGREQQYATVSPAKRKLYRTRGGKSSKVRTLGVEYANVVDPKSKKTRRVRINTVKENPANPHFVQRNIITKGATIQTEIGAARVTSRPGQDGVINAVLVKGSK